MEAARKQWLIDEPHFLEFGAHVESQIKNSIQSLGLHAEVSKRTKDIDSLIKKLIRKPAHTYESLGDKVGVRIIVKYKSEIAPVLRCVRRVLACSKPDDKLEGLGEDRVGYLSVHLDVTLRKDDLRAREFPACKFRAELQIRTLAQHLWSEMSHDVTYKGDVELPKAHRRQVKLLAGLIEIVDDVFTRLNSAMTRVSNIVETRILKALERQYYKITTRRGDSALSIRVIRVLAPIYGNKINWERHFQELFAEKEDVFRQVFGYESPDHSAFLFQPEFLMIYDLLQRNEFELRRKWNEHFPEGELERLATVFGISFD